MPGHLSLASLVWGTPHLTALNVGLVWVLPPALPPVGLGCLPPSAMLRFTSPHVVGAGWMQPSASPHVGLGQGGYQCLPGLMQAGPDATISPASPLLGDSGKLGSVSPGWTGATSPALCRAWVGWAQTFCQRVTWPRRGVGSTPAHWGASSALTAQP